ncbi:MAG: tRNA guanosine(34) transglycosylase Tgt [Candidatus Buchananbacteria bacterium]
MYFKLSKKSKKSQARLGKLKTAHGIIKTPFFMPIATKGAVKNLTAADVRQLGSPILLSNTYHLYLTPGREVLSAAGGLHKFMDWRGAILTDSGGFQVFSLAKIRKILPQGVEFRSHLDGSKHILTPKSVLDIQKVIGSDIAMILDVCPPSTAKHQEVKEAVEITTKWAKEAAKVVKSRKSRSKNQDKQLYFAIVQGGVYRDLREQSLNDLVKLNFDGYAVGGLAVGETNKEMYGVLDYLAPQLPADKPRYLMGVGTPENIIEAVKRGIDMFDCVIPTREARHGRLYLFKQVSLLSSSSRTLPTGSQGRGFINKNLYKKHWIPAYAGMTEEKAGMTEEKAGMTEEKAGMTEEKAGMTEEADFYETINITNAKYKNDFSPINNTNLKNFSKAYLHHLFKTGEPLAMRLATLNNLDFYLRLMETIRRQIKNGKL